MKSIITILLILATLAFIIVIGGGVYEHMAVVPKWKLAPPESLTMFQGKYGLNPGDFWQNIHPVAMALLIAALVANWKTARRKFILIALAGYMVGMVVTFFYFVPELLSIIQTPYQAVVDNGLVKRAALWEGLSLVRIVYCFALAMVLLYGLTRGYKVAPAITTNAAGVKNVNLIYRDVGMAEQD